MHSGGTAIKKRNTPQPAATPDTTEHPDPGAVPVTPSDVMRQECACCGAILPAPLSRLDAIPGQEHLRRAVTIALTGNHPITFLGSGTGLADALAFGRISRRYGVTAYVTTACICGNAGGPIFPAGIAPRCLSPGSGGQRFKQHWQPDLVVEAAHTSAEQRMAHRRGRRGEPLWTCVARDATEGCRRDRQFTGR